MGQALLAENAEEALDQVDPRGMRGGVMELNVWTAAKSTSAPVTAQQPTAKGMVWVNLDTKVFHREGDRYYGNTKNGKFMTESEAKAAGYKESKKD